MATMTATTTRTPTKYTLNAPLKSYHSEVMQAMCTQMVDRQPQSKSHPHPRSTARRPSHSRHHQQKEDTSAPLPFAKRHNPSTPSSSHPSSTTMTITCKSSHQSPSPLLSQHVHEEMARRAKADRVLQDLSSDKSRAQARARETARRNKWAKSIAGACSPQEVPVVKKQIAAAYPRAVRSLEGARRGEIAVAV